jgi:hypothetical protein
MNALNILINGNLYLGPPSSLNDPFEGEFILKNSGKLPDEEYFVETEERIVIDKRKMSEEQFLFELKKVYRDILQKHYGITCFSEKKDSLLMWAHYANMHRGICLVFDQEKLITSINKNYHEIRLDRVKYNKDFIPIDIRVTNSGLYFNRIEESYLNKLSHWKYEKEVRMHWYVPENFTHRNIGFDFSSIVGIILGSNLEDQHKTLLANIIANPNLKHVKWYNAIPDLKSKRVKIERFGGFFIPRSLSIARGRDLSSNKD